MCVQIELSSIAINQWSVEHRLDQMTVGQLFDEYWRNGSWVSKLGQNPCKLNF